jgi:NAD(P)-dependent dehydrogenase (short-subunit alcohol dehydrogenase family)
MNNKVALITGAGRHGGIGAAIAQRLAGRLGTPEDVAGLVAYLASDEASFIIGQLIPVTGGRELG